MADFLEVLESIRGGAEDFDAQLARMTSNGGGDAGDVSTRRLAQRRNHERKLREGTLFLAEVYSGKRPRHQLVEAMTRSDFPLVFGDIIDRSMLANYQEWPLTWPNIARRGVSNDFRTRRMFTMEGADSMLAQVGELTDYPEAVLTEGKFDIKVAKYGRVISLSWETQINDDLNFLQQLPANLARAARRTEERTVTGAFVSSTGPDSTFYSVAHKNIVTGNPTLTLAGLQTAMQVLAAQVDVNGEPIMIETVELVVPPALEIVALNIINATELWLTGAMGGGATDTQVHVANWMKNRVHVTVNPYLPVIDGTRGNTAWYLFANPSSGRPAIQIDFLRGHETPELFIQASDAQRIGGGEDPRDGSFENDSIAYKVRHVLGVSTVDFRASVASNGSGS